MRSPLDITQPNLSSHHLMIYVDGCSCQEDLFESARIYIESSGRPFNYLSTEAEVPSCILDFGKMFPTDSENLLTNRFFNKIQPAVKIKNCLKPNLKDHRWHYMNIFENHFKNQRFPISKCLSIFYVQQLHHHTSPTTNHQLNFKPPVGLAADP